MSLFCRDCEQNQHEATWRPTLGSSTPTAKTPMAITTRVTSNVISFVACAPQVCGEKRLAPCGPDVSKHVTSSCNGRYRCVIFSIWEEHVSPAKQDTHRTRFQ